MTYTYEQPQDGQWRNPIHQVRFLLRDTSQSSVSLSDEELRFLQAETAAHQNVPDDRADLYATAAQAAEYMAQAYEGLSMIQKVVGTTRIEKEFTDQQDKYKVIASRLWSRSSIPKWYGVLSGFGLVNQGNQPPRVFSSRMMDPLGSTGGASYAPDLTGYDDQPWRQVER